DRVLGDEEPTGAGGRAVARPQLVAGGGEALEVEGVAGAVAAEGAWHGRELGGGGRAGEGAVALPDLALALGDPLHGEVDPVAERHELRCGVVQASEVRQPLRPAGGEQ